MRIRKGDRVQYLYWPAGRHIAIVLKTRGPFLDRERIKIREPNDSLATTIPRSNITKIVQKREDIKEWWKYL